MRARINRRKTVRKVPRMRLPSLPRFSIDWRALLLPPLILAVLAGLGVTAQRLLDRPIGELTLEGAFRRVSALQIEAALAPALERGFLSIDLGELQDRVKTLDWIDTVKIGRVWPDRLVVRVTEHRAAARWGDTGLLNVRGELFTRNARYDFPELPRLTGPEGSEYEVASFYLAVRGRLAQAHLGLDTLSMDARGALNLLLDSGLEVRLGRRSTDHRLARFFEVVAPALRSDLPRIEYVDLRYTNGFAVGWQQDDKTEVAATGRIANSG
jgi:cell division protein FtsQ